MTNEELNKELLSMVEHIHTSIALLRGRITELQEASDTWEIDSMFDYSDAYRHMDWSLCQMASAIDQVFNISETRGDHEKPPSKSYRKTMLYKVRKALEYTYP